MRAKLGLVTGEEADTALIWDLLEVLQQGKVDYTRLFRLLGTFDSAAGAETAGLRQEAGYLGSFDAWTERYGARLRREGSEDGERRVRMDRVNPAYVLRNYLAEQAIRAARDDGDVGELEQLHQVLRTPFTEQPGMERYLAPPPDWGRALVVSCSS